MGENRHPAPPRVAEYLIQLAVADDEVRRTVLGDLHEDYVLLARMRGYRRARLWYAREAFAMCSSSVVRRFLRMFWKRRHERRQSLMISPLKKLGLAHDIRFAVRSARRDVGFFAIAVMIFGIGVGASTAVFSVMNPLMLRPLPFTAPDRLVWVPNLSGSGMSGVTSRTFNLRDFRERNQTFTGLTGYNAFFEQNSFNLLGEGAPESLVGVDVAHDFLDVLGVPPVLGRGFLPEDGSYWGGPRTVILSHDLWTNRYAADPRVVGSSIIINNEPWQVIGVLPPTFDFSSIFSPRTDVDFIFPLPINEVTDRQGNTLSIVGRLKPGVSVDAAQADLDRVLVGLRSENPDRWGLNGVNVTPLQEHIAGSMRGAFLLLAVSAAAVMLIVCVNLANLLLARGARRGKEIALRSVLGATRGRLVRQLLIESVTLSLAGAIAGTVIAYFVTRAVSQTTGINIPLLQSVSVDGSALVFTLLVAVTAGLVTGVVPAFQLSITGESQSLNSASRGASDARWKVRFREALVICEVALACVLLVFGGLFLRSFRNVLDVDLGFQTEGLVSWRLQASNTFEGPAETAAYFDRLREAASTVPGVQAVGLTDALPLGRNRSWSATGRGIEYEDGSWVSIFPHLVDREYIEAMRIPLVAGRLFTDADTPDTERVVVLNETAAARLFRGEDPIGRIVDTWTDVRVVGVVGDVRHRTLEDDAGAEVYFLQQQLSRVSTMDLVVRSDVSSETIIPSVSAALRAADGSLPTGDVRTLREVVDRSVSARRFTLLVLGTFAGTALLLAALGVYGVLSYSVAERVPEIGIRMALGESASQVLFRVVSRTMTLAGIGVGIGIGVSLIGTNFVDSLLFGLSPSDPLSFTLMAGLLLVTSALAGYIPARRAARTDPVTSFRSA